MDPAAAAGSAAACASRIGAFTMDAIASVTGSATSILRNTRALLIPVSFRRRVVSVMNMNGHADEHGRKKRENVRLHQHDDHLEPGDANRERDRHRHADTESGNRA